MASRNTILALILSSVVCVDVQADLTGDPEAIELADQLVESIGGKELWTRIHSLHVFEQSRSLRGDGIVGEFWRDLRTPRERYTLRNRSGLNIEFGWDERGVWQFVDGTEYIYGPHRKFGQISFPDWGTQVDGSWSFYYVDVRWSPEEPSVSFDPPDG